MDLGLKEFSDDSLCRIGQVVRSRKGKDVGRWYVVVGVSENGRRVFLADGVKFTPAKPKAKNTIHLQRTGWYLDEIAQSIMSEGKIDAGRFQALLAGLKRNEQQGG